MFVRYRGLLIHHGISYDKKNVLISNFLISSSQVADLSELGCTDTSDGDHDVSIWNLSVTLVIWNKEMIQY